MQQDEDYLLRHIRQLIAVILQLILGRSEEAEVDAELQSGLGLGLRTVDALTPEAVLSLFNLEDSRDRARLEGLVQVLEALGQPHRRDKAAALRRALEREHADLAPAE